jgi:hypothetical protein
MAGNGFAPLCRACFAGFGQKGTAHGFCACEITARHDHALPRKVGQSRAAAKNSMKSATGIGV